MIVKQDPSARLVGDAAKRCNAKLDGGPQTGHLLFNILAIDLAPVPPSIRERLSTPLTELKSYGSTNGVQKRTNALFEEWIVFASDRKQLIMRVAQFDKPRVER